jgi:8-oxo-dGTP diphosphatase
MTGILPIRLAVEAVVQRGSNILLVKRANTCKVAPGVWNVPAGKVEFTKQPFVEIPTAAVQRECQEEIGMSVKVIQELAVRVFEMRVGTSTAYRVAHTFLVEPEDSKAEVKLNHEHSEFAWVSKKDGWKDQKYESLSDALKEIFEKGWK